MSNKVHVTQPGIPLQGSGGSGAEGLDYLSSIDMLIVEQEVDLVEVLTGFEINNKYSISNSAGQQAYRVLENSGCLIRQLCGGARPFELYIYDNFQTEVLHISRPYRCGCCWGPASCFHEVTVVSPGSSQILGTVRQTFSWWKPALSVHDANGDQIMTIRGRCCPCGCDDVPFIVLANDGTQIGCITKKFRGCVTEFCTNADTFHLNFPMDLHVNAKATLIGALFLVDFMYFEQNNN